MAAMTVDKWLGLGTGVGLGSVIFLWSQVQNLILATLRLYLTTSASKLASYVNPYLQIIISKQATDRFKRSDLFVAVEAYLSEACARRARKLKAELGKNSKNLQLSVDDYQEVTDDFSGTMIWWYASKKQPNSCSLFSFYPGQDESRFYQVVFHRHHRDLVVDNYLPFILGEGRAVTLKNRKRRLFTNNASSSWNSYRPKSIWSHVPFEHPATFDTLAMDPEQKEAIVDDLKAFKESKEYYAKVGKAWKRGYLLYGPPGTGKSTTIAAMANYLDYDVYDLELTAVKNNTELRKLFIETTGKSIIVIEDIDCSIYLTGKRLKAKKASADKESNDDNKPKLTEEPEKDEAPKVTLSGLLNFIDGLWSSCGGEGIIIFTTNHKEKLDPALIRRGRMDKHIEMSYCRFGGFKVLVKNYLDVVAEHEMFGVIRQLLEDTDMSPADVVENLMPMSKKKRDPEECFLGLVEALNKSKEATEAAKAKEEEEFKEAEVKNTKDKEEGDVKEAKENDKGKDKTSDVVNGDMKHDDK